MYEEFIRVNGMLFMATRPYVWNILRNFRLVGQVLMYQSEQS